MGPQNPVPQDPQLTAMPPAPVSSQVLPKGKSGKVWKIIAIVLGSLIVIFILLAWWGSNIMKQEETSGKQSNNMNLTTSTTSGNSENQVETMLLPKGNSQQEVADQETAVQYIFQHPESVNPFMYAELSSVLMRQGNMEQGAFWFYIFQSRSGAWVAKATDQTGYPALKASFNEVIGRPVNEWVGSDLNAWHDLLARAISYEKKFPFYSGKIDGVSEVDWQQALLDGRQKFESGFNSTFVKLLAEDGGKSSDAQRKANGLYVGPWQNPGKPLLDEWK